MTHLNTYTNQQVSKIEVGFLNPRTQNLEDKHTYKPKTFPLTNTLLNSELEKGVLNPRTQG